MNKEMAWSLGLLLPYRKTTIPAHTIKGFERHFIRGAFDKTGTLSFRKSRRSFRMRFVSENEPLVKWVSNHITKALLLPEKKPKRAPRNNAFELSWEGNIAKLIAWYLYHGDVSHCSLSRKREKYLSLVLNDIEDRNENANIIKAANAFIDNNEIGFNVPSLSTLDWCKRLQNQLSFKTTPVFHNKGKRKYYRLYIHENQLITNTQDILLHKNEGIVH